MISHFQQQDLLSNVSDFETPAISPPSPDAIVETASKDMLEPVNTIITTEHIETNYEQSTTPKKVSWNWWFCWSPYLTTCFIIKFYLVAMHAMQQNF